jgi:regulator of protease activity HflC (stomatin/prohibitin superfamily)
MAGYPGNQGSGQEEGAPLFGPPSSTDAPARPANNYDDDDDEGCGPCYAENRGPILCCLGCLAFILVILLALSFDVVKPTEFGLLQNGWTGWVDSESVWGPGRHFVWLRNFFIPFPAYRVSVEFSSGQNASAPPVPARTGRDLNDPDSGGQPVTLSFSFQYQFKEADVGHVYKEFGEQYEARYLLFARMAISDVAQQYTPEKFWKERSTVADEMFTTLKETLRRNGRCEVTNFQLLQVDFPVKYEDMITDIQLQVQYKLTSEYQQQVTNVVKNIDVLTAETEAKIASIHAAAEATTNLIVNEAKTEGFYAQQAAKAESYAEIQAALGLSNAEVLDFVKIRAITGDNRKSENTVFGTAQPSMVL